MFGTIGHARPQPGHLDQITALMDQWKDEVRPTIPGRFIELSGTPQDRPDEIVFVALAQDEATYRALAASPAQDAWFRKLREHLEADPVWEDVELAMMVND